MFNISELDRLVYLQLSRSSLAKCARVNRTWNECAMPFLFETIPTLPYCYQQRSLLEIIAVDYFQKSDQEMNDTYQVLHRLTAILHDQRKGFPGFQNVLEAVESLSRVRAQGQTSEEAGDPLSQRLLQDNQLKRQSLERKEFLWQMESIREMVQHLLLDLPGSDSSDLVASQAPTLPQTLTPPPSQSLRFTTLSRYGSCVRSVPNVCTLLQYLQLPEECSHGVGREKISYELASHFLDQCPNLRFHHVDVCQYHIDSDELFLLMTKHIVPATQHLSIGFGESADWSTDLTTAALKRILNSTSHRLESLRLKIGSLDGSMQEVGHWSQAVVRKPVQGYLEAKKAWGFSVENSMTEFPGMKTLKELRIEQCTFSFQTKEFWLEIWDHCDQIESLTIGDVCGEVFEHLAESISGSMPRLHKIYFRTDDPAIEYELDDTAVGKILSAGKRGWTVVHFDVNAVVGPSTLSALAQHYSTLEELYFVQNVDSNVLIPILVACPNLRELVTIENEAITPIVLPEISAERFIDQDPWTYTLRPWACERTLKKLKRKVYERLARLENLEVLWLGHQPQIVLGDNSLDDALFQQDMCLEITLASGLGKLDRLKNLTELGLSGMEHGLDDKAEAEWMAKHWPKLAVVSGLDKGSEAAMWFAQNRPYVYLD
ncbi:MAG: hypothetical protein BYD32DRAFT_439939 [Podila humilis]|nr:MAG: hypothetical protein BYD32DRAFT_439939 [Podila humilis]